MERAKRSVLSGLYVLAFFIFGALHTYAQAPVSQDDLQVISVVKKFDGGFPVVNLTIKNNGTRSRILTTIKCELLSFEKTKDKGVPETRALDPEAYWAMNLPLKQGTVSFTVPTPVQIAADQGATVSIKLYVGGKERAFVPDRLGLFTFRLLLVDSDGHTARSGIISVGKR